jgi:DNA-binding XRE family transcriptional regulator
MQTKTLIAIKRFDAESFSTDVLRFRIENKLSRHRLWEMMGVGANSAILNIENKSLKPSLEIAYNLCEIMGKSINDYMV